MKQRQMWIALFVLGIGTAVTLGWLFWPRAVTVQAARPEAGGWMPDTLTAQVGEPLRLRLTAVDMMHGFTVGQIEMEPVDIPPGEVTEITLLFDEPGTYTYYCTRFCGPTHWRMRGTIEVLGDEPQTVTRPESPLYVTLGLDIDAPHIAEISWVAQPDAVQGETLAAGLPATYLTHEIYETQAPAAVWQQLRDEPAAAALTDAQIWDAVAYVWRSQTTPDTLAAGQALYEANCVFCHGPDGAGDGPLATIQPTAVPDFTDPDTMLGASTAILQGKMLRGGMGTGMPNWGTVFTDEQIASLVDYLWTFQFPTTETTAD